GEARTWGVTATRVEVSEGIVVDVLARGLVRDQVVLERSREDLGQRLDGPALVVVDPHDRAVLPEQHDLLPAHPEDLARDVLGLVSRQEGGERGGVSRGQLLDLLYPPLLRLGPLGARADQ